MMKESIKNKLRKIYWLVVIVKHYYLMLKKIRRKSRLIGYEMLYPFYRKKFKPSAINQTFSVTAKQIYGEGRTPGVSGYYRIYNEEDFLAASVESHLPFFDELILVHDSTVTDKTPEICQTLADKYPDKIKYFVYQPDAFKIRSKAYKILPCTHPNSFVNYYNFTLSKTTKQIVAKVDGDHIAIKPMFEKAMQNVNNIDFIRNTYYVFSGLNLWLHEGKIYVDPIDIPGVGDHGFHLMHREKRYYTKGFFCEAGDFSLKYRQWKHAGILYFHLRNMRSAIAFHSYSGVENGAKHQKEFQQKKIEVQKNWVDWATFVSQYRAVMQEKTATDIAQLPDPNIYLQDLIKSLSK